MQISPAEKKLLGFIASQPAKSCTLKKAVADKSLSLNQDQLLALAEKLKLAGFIYLHTDESEQYSYTNEGWQASKTGLAETRLLMAAKSGPVPISSLDVQTRSFGIAAAKKSGWILIEAGSVVLTPVGQQALAKKEYISLPSNEQEISSIKKEHRAELIRRGLIVSKTHISNATLSISPSGEAAARETAVDAIGAIDRPMLLDGSWKGKPLARYDVHSHVPSALGARRHPISRLRTRICDIFSQMGFEQMDGPLVESSFWNFDALFQPQDHPARDLADTFYLNEKSVLPDSSLVSKVKDAHQKGWQYSWQSSDAMQQVLRTHTTAVSARSLYAHSKDKSAKKFFSVGKVFRNEATDYKHLAEFFQVEGIIAWEGANFTHLLGTLKEFYSKLGFEKIRFRPSYFPYTEPSLEIEVFHEGKKEWLELGGAGIFRPEVSIPLCNKYPVLAWGLSLERPLMLSSNTPDIRTLYRNDLEWLRNFPTSSR